MSNNLTENNIEDIKEVIKEATNTEDNKFIDSLPSNNGQEESDQSLDPVTKQVAVDIDPVTGVYSQIAEELGISEEGAKLLDLKPEDFLDIPESINDVEINIDILKKNILEDKNLNIKPEETELIDEVLKLVVDYKKSPKMIKDNTNWYERLPKKLQEQVNIACSQVNNNKMSTKNTFAEYFISEIISSSGIDQIAYDMQESLNDAFNINGIMGYIITECKTEFEKGIDNMIEKFKNMPEDKIDEETRESKINLLNRISEAYRQSYTLEGFLSAIKAGKCNVKKKDIDRYARHVRTWLSKYEGDTPFVIQDPTRVPPILYRMFHKKYSAEQCVAVIIAFFKYTMNYNGHDVVDHTFMSYFISNILQLDFVTTTAEQGKFINILSNNLEEALKAINHIEDEESEESEDE